MSEETNSNKAAHIAGFYAIVAAIIGAVLAGLFSLSLRPVDLSPKSDMAGQVDSSYEQLELDSSYVAPNTKVMNIERVNFTHYWFVPLLIIPIILIIIYLGHVPLQFARLISSFLISVLILILLWIGNYWFRIENGVYLIEKQTMIVVVAFLFSPFVMNIYYVYLYQKIWKKGLTDFRRISRLDRLMVVVILVSPLFYLWATQESLMSKYWWVMTLFLLFHIHVMNQRIGIFYLSIPRFPPPS